MLPVEGSAQRSLTAAWQRVMSDGAQALEQLDTVRAPVKASWARALRRGIHPSLPRAPLPLDDRSLAALRDDIDWLPHADLAVRAHAGGSALDGHILALFDANARMLSATGDSNALEGLAEINFRPGALWSEEAVGTNGPGTALALARAVHIVGAEHFCERWHGWHCAAAPIRDPLTQEVLGVLDLSGLRERAHPHTLSLASAIAVALEQRLVARESERRVTLLRRFGALVGQYPGDAILVVDRAGEIIASSSPAERLVRRLAASGRDATDALRRISTASDVDRRALNGTARERGRNLPSQSTVRDATHPLLGAMAAVHAMHDGRTPIGACVVLPAGQARGHRPEAARKTVARTPRAVANPTTPSAVVTPVVTARGPSTVRYTMDALFGRAAVLDDVRRFARACARTDLPVLLLGESGTGKEVVAQGIHAASPRAHAPFVAVNCAALPRELVESELFGHVAGAFSRARRDGAIGKFEAADGGTLFLDEIATNRDITNAIASGTLRDDLYHRLNLLTIALPPLRTRHGDAVLLAEYFLGQTRGTLARDFSPRVRAAFERYRWPGNVRELENLVKRLAALAEGPTITEEILPAALREVVDAAPPAAVDVTDVSAFDALDDTAAAVESHRQALRARYATLIAGHATMSDAAKSIGITRSTLYRRLQRIGLAPGRGGRDSS